MSTTTLSRTVLADSRLLLRTARMQLRPAAPVRPFSRVAVRMPAQRRGVAAVGLAAGVSALCASSWAKPAAHCEPAPPAPEVPLPHDAPPSSIANVYELSFGTICGLCAGVFIKKGFKLIAGILGGVYVLLQFLASKGVVKINWQSIESVYRSGVDSAARAGDEAGATAKNTPPLVRIWHNMIDFLTTDFQQRATFIAGLVLGLRLG